MTGLKEQYNKKAVPAMKEKFGLKNVMALPKIEKIVVSTGFGKIITPKTSDEQKKTVVSISEGLAMITGQKPVITKAKKSISTFKLREGMPIGAKVVLRGKKMYDFLERVLAIAIPRVRDFRGLDPKGFDKAGNFTMGFKEHTIFPEISPEKTKIVFGFEVTIVTKAGNKEKGMELLKLLGFPFKKEQQK
jgi:large subunit ribosomal protein L5